MFGIWAVFDICICTTSRVHNIYNIEESILLSYTPVEGRIVKFGRNDKMLWFVTYEQP